MVEQPHSSPENILAEAQRVLVACRATMRSLLARAQYDYRDTLSELDQLVSSSVERRDEPLVHRVENLQRSKELQRTAEMYDSAIGRLTQAADCVGEAEAMLHGNATGLRSTREVSDQSLEAVAIQAQEEERYRLAREIHDGPAQILANVALQLEYISKLATRDPARARYEMENIQKDLRLAVGEVRRFMYDLRPPALAQQGVGPAVESHCQRLAHRFGLTVRVDWQSAAVLPPSHDTAVFRIVQEALQNIVKHAQAMEVEVRATEVDGALEVTVADNGKGFEVENAGQLDPKHFGLAGMRARAQQIGANLDVSSASGRGTCVRVTVPLA